MGKDSYWFRHDSGAGRGLKLRKIQHIYSHWGKGIYWDVVEVLRDQEDYRYENDETSLQMLCDLIGCKDIGKFENWFKSCIDFGLFDNGKKYFSCPPLTESMKRWESSKANGQKGGRPPKNKPKKNPDDNPKKTINNTVHNSTKEKRFEGFWNLYNKKRGKPKAKAAFMKLSDKDIDALSHAVTPYVLSTLNVKFRKDPATWLNGRHWEDEIIEETGGEYVPKHHPDSDYLFEKVDLTKLQS